MAAATESEAATYARIFAMLDELKQLAREDIARNKAMTLQALALANQVRSWGQSSPAPRLTVVSSSNDEGESDA
jgi:hypothetical protein